MMNETSAIPALQKTRQPKESNLLEVMEICSNMYLTHLLAARILGEEARDDFSELGESPLIIAVLSLDAPFFFERLSRIH